MSEGLQTTLKILAGTRNAAADRVLLHALDSARAEIREGAIEAILSRRSVAGHVEVLRRLDRLDPASREIVLARHSQMTRAVHDAVLSNDSKLAANGWQAAIWFREYDLVPALLNVLEDPSTANAESASRTLVELADLLYGELSGHRSRRRRDPELARRSVIEALEQSVARFATHRRKEVLRVYLLLVPHDNPLLTRILGDPHHAVYLPLIDELSKSDSPGVIRLLLSLLDDARVPVGVLSIAGKRCDVPFVQYFLRKAGHEASGVLRQNLKRIKSIGWMEEAANLLAQLAEPAEREALEVVMATGVPRASTFALVTHLLRHGRPAGRKAAAEALNGFPGAEANALAEEALDDDDPYVLAAILPQLRQRGIVGALPQLLKMIDSPYEVVRTAARGSLTEFSFQRFLAAFEMLDEEVRYSTGELVKKIDPETIPELRTELKSHMRTRRLRAMEVADVLGVVDKLEEGIAKLMGDTDHIVRAEAARTLGQGRSLESWQALQQALGDRSVAVQEAARQSIRARGGPPRELESAVSPNVPQGDPR